MNSVQTDVLEFHLACGIPAAQEPQRLTGDRAELRAVLLAEEAQETIRALKTDDLIETLDGLCDLLAVVYGTAVELGIDLQPYWEEVHTTNMAKSKGPKREDGKQLKPEGWQPPDLRKVLYQTAPPWCRILHERF